MHPHDHALGSAKRFGGQPEEYLSVHTWFDESKAFMGDFRHRALRHHAEGIFLSERIFGATLRISTGQVVPVRLIGEHHVREDLGFIPTVQDWLREMRPALWMQRGKATRRLIITAIERGQPLPA